MGNQGYSHEATRVACEIIWSGEIGDVTEAHSFKGMPQWPQEMPRIPPPTPVPDTLNWDAWLGTAAWREFTVGDQAYVDFVPHGSGAAGRLRGRRSPGSRSGAPAVQREPQPRLAEAQGAAAEAGFRILPALQLARFR